MVSSVASSRSSEQHPPAPTSAHCSARSSPTLLELPQEIRNMIYAYIPRTTSIHFDAGKIMIRSRHPFLSINQQLRYEFCSERIRDEVVEITCFPRGLDQFRIWLLFAPRDLRITKLEFMVRHYQMEKDALFCINLSLGNAWSCDFKVEPGTTCREPRDAKRNQMILRGVETTIWRQARRRAVHKNDFVFLRHVLNKIWVLSA